MFPYLLLLVLAACPGIALPDPIYKTTDEFGNPVFSDQGGDNAEEVEVNEPVIYDSGSFRQPVVSTRKEPPLEDSGSFRYETLAVISPENDSAVRNNAGNLTIRYRIDPPVQAGHVVELLMDEEILSTVAGTGSLSLENIDRGTHRFRLRVTADGEILQEGPVTSVTLLRVSRLQRARSAP